MDAIHQALITEQRARKFRSAMWGVLLGLLVIGVPAILGTKPMLLRDWVALGGGALVIALGLAFAASPSVRVPGWAAYALATMACLFPMLPAALTSTPWQPAHCILTIVALGAFAVVSSGFILNTTRRRFGGAPELMAAATAMAASLGMGVSCTFPGALHLFTHTLGAALVVVFFFLRFR